MTRECPYCDDVVPAEKWDEHLADCMAHLPAPAPPARFVVCCTFPGCYLNRKPLSYPDAFRAEQLGWIHEERHKEFPDDHSCVVQDQNEVPPSMNPTAGDGRASGG